METEKRLLSFAREVYNRLYLVRLNTNDAFLSLSMLNKNKDAVVHYMIKLEKQPNGSLSFFISDDSAIESRRYTSLKAMFGEGGVISADCRPLPKIRW